MPLDRLIISTMQRSITCAPWALALGLALPALATAQLRMPAPEESRSGYTWSLGASISNGASYPGSTERSTGIRPVIGLEVGRFTLSSGGGGSLLDFDLDARDSGVTAKLLQWENLRLSAGLRMDGGRKGSDEPMLQGLPEVERTLRGRLSVIYDFNKHASVRSTLSQDLLGRDGGATLQTTARYEIQVSPYSEIAFALGFTLADSTYMQGRMGVPLSASGVSTPLPAYVPGGGLFSQDVGLEFKSAVSDRWVVFGGVRYSQLRGNARRSPLAVKPDNYGISLGLAYRCCR